MAKVVYDPTVDRKQKPTPLASDVVKAKIANNEVKIKGKTSKAKRETKAKETAEPEKKPAKLGKPTFTDEQFIEALKAIGHAATSREISDKLGIKDADRGRQLVRTHMAKLEEEGKVVIKEAPEGTRARKVYSLG